MDHGIHPLHIQVTQTLKMAPKRICLKDCHILADMTNNKPDIVNVMVFSDEATFHTSGHVHRNNTIFGGFVKSMSHYGA